MTDQFISVKSAGLIRNKLEEVTESKIELKSTYVDMTFVKPKPFELIRYLEFRIDEADRLNSVTGTNEFKVLITFAKMKVISDVIKQFEERE